MPESVGLRCGYFPTSAKVQIFWKRTKLGVGSELSRRCVGLTDFFFTKGIVFISVVLRKFNFFYMLGAGGWGFLACLAEPNTILFEWSFLLFV